MNPAASARARVVAIYIVAWLPLHVMYTVMLWRTSVAEDVATALLYSTSYIIPAIVAGAVVWQIARRVPWRKLAWWQFAGIELGLGLGYIAAWQAMFFFWLMLRAGREAVVENAAGLLSWPLLMVVLVTGLHSVMFHVVRNFSALKEREVAAAAAEAARVRAEMLVLRGQLDPHFLFNSLHSITALVREDPVRAEEALLQFGALLRRVLAVKRDSADEVTLGEEMKFIEEYLAIERLRLGERLKVRTEISPVASACRVPAFSVQPLVENAIRHAIAPRRNGGTLTLRARVVQDTLEVFVHDDGPGAEPAVVAGATGVGLSVIRQRLRLRHGDGASAVVDTAPGRGFGITLMLPAVTEEASA